MNKSYLNILVEAMGPPRVGLSPCAVSSFKDMQDVHDNNEKNRLYLLQFLESSDPNYELLGRPFPTARDFFKCGGVSSNNFDMIQNESNPFVSSCSQKTITQSRKKSEHRKARYPKRVDYSEKLPYKTESKNEGKTYEVDCFVKEPLEMSFDISTDEIKVETAEIVLEECLNNSKSTTEATPIHSSHCGIDETIAVVNQSHVQNLKDVEIEFGANSAESSSKSNDVLNVETVVSDCQLRPVCVMKDVPIKSYVSPFAKSHLASLNNFESNDEAVVNASQLPIMSFNQNALSSSVSNPVSGFKCLESKKVETDWGGSQLPPVQPYVLCNSSVSVVSKSPSWNYSDVETGVNRSQFPHISVGKNAPFNRSLSPSLNDILPNYETIEDISQLGSVCVELIAPYNSTVSPNHKCQSFKSSCAKQEASSSPQSSISKFDCPNSIVRPEEKAKAPEICATSKDNPQLVQCSYGSFPLLSKSPSTSVITEISADIALEDIVTSQNCEHHRDGSLFTSARSTDTTIKIIQTVTVAGIRERNSQESQSDQPVEFPKENIEISPVIVATKDSELHMPTSATFESQSAMTSYITQSQSDQPVEFLKESIAISPVNVATKDSELHVPTSAIFESQSAMTSYITKGDESVVVLEPSDCNDVGSVVEKIAHEGSVANANVEKEEIEYDERKKPGDSDSDSEYLERSSDAEFTYSTVSASELEPDLDGNAANEDSNTRLTSQPVTYQCAQVNGQVSSEPPICTITKVVGGVSEPLPNVDAAFTCPDLDEFLNEMEIVGDEPVADSNMRPKDQEKMQQKKYMNKEKLQNEMVNFQTPILVETRHKAANPTTGASKKPPKLKPRKMVIQRRCGSTYARAGGKKLLLKGSLALISSTKDRIQRVPLHVRKKIGLVIYPSGTKPLHPLATWHLHKVRSNKTSIDLKWATFAASAVITKNDHLRRRMFIPVSCSVQASQDDYVIDQFVKSPVYKLLKIRGTEKDTSEVKNVLDDLVSLIEKRGIKEQPISECFVPLPRIQCRNVVPWCMEHNKYACWRCGLDFGFKIESCKKTIKPFKASNSDDDDTMGHLENPGPNSIKRKRLQVLLPENYNSLPVPPHETDFLTILPPAIPLSVMEKTKHILENCERKGVQPIDFSHASSVGDVQHMSFPRLRELFVSERIDVYFSGNRAFVTSSSSPTLDFAVNMRSQTTMPGTIRKLFFHQIRKFAILYSWGLFWEICGSIDPPEGTKVIMESNRATMCLKRKLKCIPYFAKNLIGLNWLLVSLDHTFDCIKLLFEDEDWTIPVALISNDTHFIQCPVEVDGFHPLFGVYKLDERSLYIAIGPYYLREHNVIVYLGKDSCPLYPQVVTFLGNEPIPENNLIPCIQQSMNYILAGGYKAGAMWLQATTANSILLHLYYSPIETRRRKRSVEYLVSNIPALGYFTIYRQHRVRWLDHPCSSEKKIFLENIRDLTKFVNEHVANYNHVDLRWRAYPSAVHIINVKPFDPSKTIQRRAARSGQMMLGLVKACRNLQTAMGCQKRSVFLGTILNDAISSIKCLEEIEDQKMSEIRKLKNEIAIKMDQWLKLTSETSSGESLELRKVLHESFPSKSVVQPITLLRNPTDGQWEPELSSSKRSTHESHGIPPSSLPSNNNRNDEKHSVRSRIQQFRNSAAAKSPKLQNVHIAPFETIFPKVNMQAKITTQLGIADGIVERSGKPYPRVSPYRPALSVPCSSVSLKRSAESSIFNSKASSSKKPRFPNESEMKEKYVIERQAAIRAGSFNNLPSEASKNVRKIVHMTPVELADGWHLKPKVVSPQVEACPPTYGNSVRVLSIMKSNAKQTVIADARATLRQITKTPEPSASITQSSVTTCHGSIEVIRIDHSYSSPEKEESDCEKLDSANLTPKLTRSLLKPCVENKGSTSHAATSNTNMNVTSSTSESHNMKIPNIVLKACSRKSEDNSNESDLRVMSNKFEIKDFVVDPSKAETFEESLSHPRRIWTSFSEKEANIRPINEDPPVVGKITDAPTSHCPSNSRPICHTISDQQSDNWLDESAHIKDESVNSTNKIPPSRVADEFITLPLVNNRSNLGGTSISLSEVPTVAELNSVKENQEISTEVVDLTSESPNATGSAAKFEELLSHSLAHGLPSNQASVNLADLGDATIPVCEKSIPTWAGQNSMNENQGTSTSENEESRNSVIANITSLALECSLAIKVPESDVPRQNELNPERPIAVGSPHTDTLREPQKVKRRIKYTPRRLELQQNFPSSQNSN